MPDPRRVKPRLCPAAGPGRCHCPLPEEACGTRLVGGLAWGSLPRQLRLKDAVFLLELQRWPLLQADGLIPPLPFLAVSSEACSCLYKQKATRWIRHYGTCRFSKDYCAGTTTNSGSFDGKLCALPVKKEIKQLSSLEC